MPQAWEAAVMHPDQSGGSTVRISDSRC
jgi:hypothetical protein